MSGNFLHVCMAYRKICLFATNIANYIPMPIIRLNMLGYMLTTYTITVAYDYVKVSPATFPPLVVLTLKHDIFFWYSVAPLYVTILIAYYHTLQYLVNTFCIDCCISFTKPRWYLV